MAAVSGWGWVREFAGLGRDYYPDNLFRVMSYESTGGSSNFPHGNFAPTKEELVQDIRDYEKAVADDRQSIKLAEEFLIKDLERLAAAYRAYYEPAN
jgi:hypothetical protein